MFEHRNYDDIYYDNATLIFSGKIKPRDDLVIAEALEDKNDGSIIRHLKHTRKDFDTEYCYGVVLAVGSGDYNKKGHFIATQIKIGQTILLKRAYMMREVVGDKVIYVTKEKDVLGVVDDE
mgnify:CR=1 FL=1